MRRVLIINSAAGEVRRFECPNPECKELLTIPDDDVYERKTLFDCKCGDDIHLLRRGSFIIYRAEEEKIKKRNKRLKDNK